jgi:dynein heavy chain
MWLLTLSLHDVLLSLPCKNTATYDVHVINAANALHIPLLVYLLFHVFHTADLASIDPMYQYSLPWYVSLFVASIRAAEASDKVDQRLDHIQAHFTYSLYRNVCR